MPCFRSIVVRPGHDSLNDRLGAGGHTDRARIAFDREDRSPHREMVPVGGRARMGQHLFASPPGSAAILLLLPRPADPGFVFVPPSPPHGSARGAVGRDIGNWVGWCDRQPGGPAGRAMGKTACPPRKLYRKVILHRQAGLDNRQAPRVPCKPAARYPPRRSRACTENRKTSRFMKSAIPGS
jgi:hypothetical protein